MGSIPIGSSNKEVIMQEKESFNILPNFTLSQDGNFMNGWETKGLSRLGKVTRVSFSMDSNDKNEYGVKAPCYFAFDNVKVKQ